MQDGWQKLLKSQFLQQFFFQASFAHILKWSYTAAGFIIKRKQKTAKGAKKKRALKTMYTYIFLRERKIEEKNTREVRFEWLQFSIF